MANIVWQQSSAYTIRLARGQIIENKTIAVFRLQYLYCDPQYYLRVHALIPS
jgi:hypothetical protein